MGKAVWVVIGSVVVLGGAGAAAVAYQKNQKQVDPSTEVALHTVENGALVRSVSAPGTVVPRTNVEISAQVSARLVELPVKEGDRVKAGDLVVRLDARDLEARLEARRAQLQAAQAQLKGSEADVIEARADFERLSGLFETKDISEQEFDRARARLLRSESSVDVIKAQILQARADIAAAERDLENAVIVSPIDGVVTRIAAEVGELVVVGTLNNPGSVIMEIADLSDILVRARIDETNVADVTQGQRARIYLHAYPDREFTGTVEFVRLRREQGNDGSAYVEAEVQVDVGEGDQLFSGLAANVDVEVEKRSDVLLVPSQAIVDRRVEDMPREIARGNEHVDMNKTFARVVYVHKDGKTVATPVTTGPSDLTHTVVTGGIEVGEQVVSGPFRVLVDLKHDTSIRDIDAPVEDEEQAGEETSAVEGEDSSDAEQADSGEDAGE